MTALRPVDLAHRAKTAARLASAPDLSDPIYTDENAAHAEIFRRKYQDGILRCLHCQTEKPYTTGRGDYWKCRKCRRQFSITSGTLMSARKQTLTYFLKVERLAQDGILSASQIAEITDADYKWTWVLLQKIKANGGKLL